MNAFAMLGSIVVDAIMDPSESCGMLATGVIVVVSEGAREY